MTPAKFYEQLMALSTKFQRSIGYNLNMRSEGELLYVTAQSISHSNLPQIEHFECEINSEYDRKQLIKDLNEFLDTQINKQQIAHIDLAVRATEFLDKRTLEYLITDEGFQKFKDCITIRLDMLAYRD